MTAALLALVAIVLVLVWRMNPSRVRLNIKGPGVQLEIESDRQSPEPPIAG